MYIPCSMFARSGSSLYPGFIIVRFNCTYLPSITVSSFCPNTTDAQTTYICTYMYIQIHTCINTYVRTYTCAHIRTYCMYIHTIHTPCIYFTSASVHTYLQRIRKSCFSHNNYICMHRLPVHSSYIRTYSREGEKITYVHTYIRAYTYIHIYIYCTYGSETHRRQVP